MSLFFSMSWWSWKLTGYSGCVFCPGGWRVCLICLWRCVSDTCGRLLARPSEFIRRRSMAAACSVAVTSPPERWSLSILVKWSGRRWPTNENATTSRVASAVTCSVRTPTTSSTRRWWVTPRGLSTIRVSQTATPKSSLSTAASTS